LGELAEGIVPQLLSLGFFGGGGSILASLVFVVATYMLVRTGLHLKAS
jgi:hypothetical protein